MVKILYCEDPLNSRHPDEMYAREVSAARTVGIEYHIFNYEALVSEQNPEKAVRQVPVQENETLIVYRGWMVTPDQYRQLYDALQDKGTILINTPDAYFHCHYLPESYDVIKAQTPLCVWLAIDGNIVLDEIMKELSIFGDKPLILKDYVKSQKHYWHEAGFIPSASDRDAVERVTNRFIELQDESPSGGLVYREWIEFESLTAHSKSKMPLTKEFRVVVLDSEPIMSIRYWEEGDYDDVSPPIEDFREIMNEVRSRFFTMDVAKRKDGKWMIVELGDAQVAGLPEHADVDAFCTARFLSGQKGG